MGPWIAGIVVLCAVDNVWACAVCFGDPESPMAKGAVAGILVLLGVVGCVLTAFVGTGLYWIRRSRCVGHNGAKPDSRMHGPGGGEGASQR